MVNGPNEQGEAVVGEVAEHHRSRRGDPRRDTIPNLCRTGPVAEGLCVHSAAFRSVSAHGALHSQSRLEGDAAELRVLEEWEPAGVWPASVLAFGVEDQWVLHRRDGTVVWPGGKWVPLRARWGGQSRYCRRASGACEREPHAQWSGAHAGVLRWGELREARRLGGDLSNGQLQGNLDLEPSEHQVQPQSHAKRNRDNDCAPVRAREVLPGDGPLASPSVNSGLAAEPKWHHIILTPSLLRPDTVLRTLHKRSGRHGLSLRPRPTPPFASVSRARTQPYANGPHMS